MLARSPFVPGKTRLTHGLPPDTAAALRTALLLDAMEAALASGWPLHVYLDPGDHLDGIVGLLDRDRDLARALDRCRFHQQGQGDLGLRMTDAMRRTLDGGHDAVVLTGSDVPDLPADALCDAVAALHVGERDERLVFGPASDGGFYLVAATRVVPSVFDGVAWGRGAVLDAVMARARTAGRDIVLVSPWHDVDTPTDLARIMAGDEATARRTRLVARSLQPYNEPAGRVAPPHVPNGR